MPVQCTPETRRSFAARRCCGQPWSNCPAVVIAGSWPIWADLCCLPPAYKSGCPIKQAMMGQENVKPACTPDSVHGGCPPRDCHSSGPEVAFRLGAAYPPAPRATSTLAYLALLHAEIARFTRFCNRLVSVALIRTLRWRGVTSCAALCSPDVPLTRCFHACYQRQSGGLYAAHCH